MDEKDEANNIKSEEICAVQGCGCSVNYLILGIVVFFMVIFVAAAIIK